MTITAWWTITEHDLLAALREAADGGDPDVIMLGLEANAREVDYYDDAGDGWVGDDDEDDAS